MEQKTAVVAFRKCGCVVAVDLDGEKKSIDDYIRRGLGVRWETPIKAKELIQAPKCNHIREDNDAN